MSETKSKLMMYTASMVFLSLLLIFFTLPHILEDFSLGEPAKNGVNSHVLAYVVAGLVALQGLALFWTGQKKRRSYVIHTGLGILWPLAAGVAQLPAILGSNNFRAGFISIFFVVGIIVVGILLSLISIKGLMTSYANPDGEK